ncbi:4-hydroxythreonine-4-phosphate dehydrogenase PdxA [Halothiobacillus diazotrophicus]|uniref:4-hydroxythreonine-4-phosphate dehydrogenase n=1 Tax=Halothiobacillus diazotrophicus TaxID=1860122 RepID=A0A191ZGI3_9GAMM|nr:4-hydroxythreonine-4-phosphate dehydrogenase PdxA [Halothiobacillus diazotrophicus]ANJ66996.1 4-hydroxythreonine-4-phosphate dehydrogenase PdxA [Halothiobacillus diazotrophicus]
MIPRLAVTSGEPAGIGPDLLLTLSPAEFPAELVVMGDRHLFADRAAQLGVAFDWPDYDPQQPTAAGVIRFHHHPLAQPARAGHLDAHNARYVLAMLDSAADGCVQGAFAAMVTAPVQKSVINEAGIAFSGHTEYLAERVGGHPVMMLAADQLRVALATTHLPLSAVPAAITYDTLLQVLRILHADLARWLKKSQPRILVTGLNPHAGESGHLGREEIEVIGPALEQARSEGIQAIGPLPADTLFTPTHLNGADAVLAMYHDQGLPVLKYAGFGEAVNITLGLPIIRTSVDHGTALSLAGTGRAQGGSLRAAIRAALSLTGADDAT